MAAKVERELDGATTDTAYKGSFAPGGRAPAGAVPALDVPIYAVDALVRRSEPLQETVLGVAGQGAT